MKNKHIKKLLLCAMTMSITLSVSARVNDTTARVVVIVSGGAAVSPYTTPTKACKVAPPPAALYSAGTTDSFMREYLLGKGQRVFTSPATIGLGKVPEQSDHQFSNCPQALPDYMTVKRGVAIFAKDLSGLPARKISKKSRDRPPMPAAPFVLVTSFRPNKGKRVAPPS